MITPELKKFIAEHQNDDVNQLALQALKYPTLDFAFALQQIKGRRISLAKIPTWAANAEVVYPPRLSMEQCSSETTARFKASLCKGKTLVDLTGGFGIDFYFMAKNFQQAIYVEQSQELEKIASQNFNNLGLKQAETFCQDSVDFLQKMNFKADTIFIDPARRSATGRKTVLLEDCTPDLRQIDQLLNEKSEETIIKLSPMLDIAASTRSLSNISDVYVIAVQNEVKELLLRKTQADKDIQIHTLNFKAENSPELFVFSLNGETNAQVVMTSNVHKYLYEPNASLLKAGAYKIIGEHYSLQKLHPNSHLYTSNALTKDFPGRVFQILDIFAFNNSELKRLQKIAPKANLSIRNFPSSVESLRKKLKLKDGGDFYLFATTLADNQKKLLLTQKVDALD